MHQAIPNELGYNIRGRDGALSLRKFCNALDWSLDTAKLKEVYEKDTRKKNFGFVADGQKYTQVVINVKFNYSYKEYNKAGANTFVRAGYNFRDCVFDDGICVVNGELVAIQTNVEIHNPVPQTLLGSYFAYADGCYVQTGTIKVLRTKADLRRELYENGFVCDGIRYVRYKRSSGSSRVGKCLFVQEAVAAKMSKWDKCGLTVKPGDAIDLAAYEAYISLPMSSIIDTIEIRPENILVVDDYDSTFEDEVVAVEEKNGRLTVERKTTEVTNTIWDGESLLDVSMFGEYSDKGMLLLRNRFFKTCAFNTNIAEWFAANGITDVSQLHGFTLATDISQVKLITTPSSIKYLKFGTLEQWLTNIDPVFGVVKHEKETHFFDGRKVQTHYQLLNTLQLSYKDVERFLKPSLDYIGAVRRDPTALRYHIGYSLEDADDEQLRTPTKTKNDIVFKLLGLNKKFASTKLYKDFRDSVVKAFCKNLRRGHVLVNGNYATLFSNGVELLQAAIGKFNGEPVIGGNNIRTTRFKPGDKILGTRSPHVTMGNIALFENVSNALIDRYFNMTNEIVYINCIGNNILQRLSGADMDSDTMLLTDDCLLVEAAERNYDAYKVPTNLVKSQKIQRYFTPSDQASLDVKTSVNKIGEIVNLSQELNSIYWERRHGGATVAELEDLYNDICKLDVLSGIEIDKAKREFTIDSGREISALKTKYRLEDTNGQNVRPMFFRMITLENGYELPSGTTYRYFETPMDYLQRVINSANFRQARESRIDVIPLMDIVRVPNSNSKSGYYSAIRDDVIAAIRSCKDEITRLYGSYREKLRHDDEEANAIRREAAERKQQVSDMIDKMSSHEYLLYIVLKELEAKENRAIRQLMFEILFGKPNETFMKMIKQSREQLPVLVEDPDGEECFYDVRFHKVMPREAA